MGVEAVLNVCQNRLPLPQRFAIRIAHEPATLLTQRKRITLRKGTRKRRKRNSALSHSTPTLILPQNTGEETQNLLPSLPKALPLFGGGDSE